MHNTKLYNANYCTGVKIAAESPFKPAEGAKMLDTGVSASLVDYLFGGLAPSSRVRAGRAQGLAEAANIDPGLAVKYPMLSQLAGGVGSAVAQTVGAATGRPGLGLIASILSHFAPIISRRMNISNIIDKLRDTDNPAQLSHIKPKGSGSRLLPFTAPTSRGHTDVYEALQTGKAPKYMGLYDFANNLTGITPGLNVIGDLASRVNTANRISSLSN